MIIEDYNYCIMYYFVVLVEVVGFIMGQFDFCMGYDF